MKQKLVRAGLGLFLLPLCYGVLRSLWAVALDFQHVPEGSVYFLIGFAGYLIFQWVFFKPMRTYVFGHELTHAVAAWVTGGEVHHFKVSKKGGSVVVTKPNLFVALAPYMIPFYSLMLLGLFYTINFFRPLELYWNYFLGLLGASLAFHAALTLYALRQNQPDLKSGGTFLSGVLIVLGNSLVLIFLLGVLFPHTVSWSVFLRSTKTHTITLCRFIGTEGSRLWVEGHRQFNGSLPK